MHAIADFFNSDDFMPHGHCFLWQPEILWLHVISDAGIVAAYFAIPFALLYFIWKRKDLPFQKIFFLFGAFILLCGTTHAMAIWVIWHPDYALEGVIKALTAAASITTFFVTVALIPQALAIPSPSQLALVNGQLHDANRTLESLYEQSRESGQAHLRAVVDHAVDGLITIDARGNVESFNPACERIFGYKGDEVIGHNIKMLMPEPYHTRHDGYLHHYATTGEAKIIGTSGREVSAKRKDGSVFPMDLSISAFTLDDGQHFSGIIRDITARKRMEESKGLLAAIVASSEDAIISKTLEGRITSWNVGAEHLFGYSAPEAIGRHVSFIIPPDRLEEDRHIVDEMRLGHSVDHLETVRLTKDGRAIDVSLTVSPLRDASGNTIGASKIIRDITQRKKSDEQLLGYTQALERSNQELDDFAYIASHDLKEPLRGLFNHASFLLEDYKDKLSEDGVFRLIRMTGLAQRMERLVNDLLYFSRLGRAEMAVQETDINAVIDDIRQMMESFLKERHASIVVPKALPRIVCDGTRVTEVFRNLITNAVKYNDKPSPIIEVGFHKTLETPQGKEHGVFYVKDNGIGIAPEFHEEIFRIFKRLQSPVEDKNPGTGVGLTFVKKIVERCHGRVWLESAPGTGSIFYFTIGRRPA